MDKSCATCIFWFELLPQLWREDDGGIMYQTNLFERPKASLAGCSKCICENCLYWWSNRCPYGGCMDDFRVHQEPYDKAHPNDPPRTTWSNWQTDQAYWCRGGVFYPAQYCVHYQQYEGQSVKTCLMQNVSIFQDGYILCELVDTIGCEMCFKIFEERMQKEEK